MSNVNRSELTAEGDSTPCGDAIGATGRVIRTLIVDDTMSARAMIRRHLAPIENIVVVGECDNGASALAAIRKMQPDLVFLDVQMSNMGNLGAAAGHCSDQQPVVMFVTAVDGQAMQAVYIHAIDDLLEGFDNRRLELVLMRVRELIAVFGSPESSSRGELTIAVPAVSEVVAPYPKRMAVKDGAHVRLVGMDEINWIEAQGNYCALHLDRTTRLMRETMGALERRLDPRIFVRIHRGVLVRLDRVVKVKALLNGDQSIWLADGTELRVSRSFRSKFMNSLQSV